LDGREVGFEYGEKTYGITRNGADRNDGPFELYEANNEASVQSFDALEELLNCEFDGLRLREIIKQLKILWRNV